METRSLVCFVVLLLVGIASAATPTCKIINDCACTPTDTPANETGVINFFPLANATGAKPMFMVNGTSQQTKLMYTFSYNPCVGFNVTGTTTESPCTNDYLCQKDIKNSFVYNIGERNNTKFAYVNNVLFVYYYSGTSVNRTSEVRLICDPSETTGKFVFVAEPKMLYYQFNFTSMCACPGKCPNKTIIPDEWVKTDDRCTYRQIRSGKVVNLQGLNAPLKAATNDYTTYYYNPCNDGFKLGSLDDECKNTAMCQQDTSKSPVIYRGIGSTEPEMYDEDGDLVLHYHAGNGRRGFDVRLICDQSADEPVFSVFGDKATVRSTHACPQ